ncbi:MAG: Smr/MutS family protein [Woeseiaceae bacterium]|nr:Smr/MutS family protein [Woeseiaceae bacterium]
MTRRKKTGVTDDDDAALFRRLVGDARPIGQSDKIPEHKPRVAARARFRRRDDRDALRESLEADIETVEEGAGETLRWQRPSVGRRTMRRLARGNYSVQDEIDLHGMTVPEARDALHAFLESCLKRGHTCIRVVHGKGLGSGHRGPILKSKVNKWLRQWKEVLAFVSARQVDGGTGALYVLLKK